MLYCWLCVFVHLKQKVANTCSKKTRTFYLWRKVWLLSVSFQRKVSRCPDQLPEALLLAPFPCSSSSSKSLDMDMLLSLGASVGADMSWVEPEPLAGLDSLHKWFCFALFSVQLIFFLETIFSLVFCAYLERRWKSPQDFLIFKIPSPTDINITRGL